MASDAPEGEGSNAAVLGVNAGPLFNVHLKVNDPPTVRSLSSKVADALSFGLRAAGIGIGAAGIGIGVAATGTVITIGFLCYKHPEFVTRVVEKALTARGLQVGTVTPGSILVELHCYTEESFRSFMEDFEAKKVQERLNKEFESSGYIGDELEVTMTNYKEAYKFLEQISRQPESSKRDIGKREVSDDRDPTVAGKKVTVERYFSEAISFSTAAKRKGELLSPGSGFESFGGSYGATMGAPRELEGPVPKRGKSSASSEAGQSVATTSGTADVIKDGVPTDKDLQLLSMKLGEDWKFLAQTLGFGKPEISAFHKQNEELREKALEMLLKWRAKYGKGATFRVLYDALCDERVDQMGLAQKYCC